MAYPPDAIPMNLRHLQDHSLLQAFRCDFCPRLWLRGSCCHRMSVWPSVFHKPELYQNGYT